MKDIGQAISDVEMSSLDGLASRLGLVIALSGMNQGEFAKAIGASAAFVSDVVRGQKKPGAEFLLAIRQAVKVSIDWLLTGEGSMSGESRIDLDWMRAIRLRVSLAELAGRENDQMARAVLDLIENERLTEVVDEPAIQSFLNSALDRPVPIDLILTMYNSQVWNQDRTSAGKTVLSDAIAYFQAKKPVDFSALLHQEKAESKYSQVNIGSGNRIAGRDYHEE